MSAMQVSTAGGDFELVEREVPEPGPDAALVRVHACGVCHSDSYANEGTYPGVAHPLVPGHEIAGKIAELGERPRLDFGSLVEPDVPNRSNGGPAVESQRPVWFDEFGFVDTDVYIRSDFEVGDRIAGPAVVEQDDTTTVIDPGMVAVADPHGNLILRFEVAGA